MIDGVESRATSPAMSYAGARRAGRPRETVHLATDDAVRPLPPDEPATTA